MYFAHLFGNFSTRSLYNTVRCATCLLGALLALLLASLLLVAPPGALAAQRHHSARQSTSKWTVINGHRFPVRYGSIVLNPRALKAPVFLQMSRGILVERPHLVAPKRTASNSEQTPSQSGSFAPADWCGDPTKPHLPYPKPKLSQRVQVIYLHPWGTQSRAKEIGRNMQWIADRINEQMAAASGGKRAIRFARGSGCGEKYISVLSVTLPGLTQDLMTKSFLNSDTKLPGQIAFYLHYTAALSTHWNYLFIYDYVPNDLTNTVGYGQMPITSIFGGGDAPAAGGLSAVVLAPYTYPQDYGLFAAVAVMHELGHTMGAVDNTAPHSTGEGHCNDGVSTDVMCYDDGGQGPFVDACGSASEQPVGAFFDCNQDDYFNVNPAPDSFLGQNPGANVANSKLLCREGENCIISGFGDSISPYSDDDGTSAVFNRIADYIYKGMPLAAPENFEGYNGSKPLKRLPSSDQSRFSVSPRNARKGIVRLRLFANLDINSTCDALFEYIYRGGGRSRARLSSVRFMLPAIQARFDSPYLSKIYVSNLVANFKTTPNYGPALAKLCEIPDINRTNSAEFARELPPGSMIYNSQGKLVKVRVPLAMRPSIKKYIQTVYRRTPKKKRKRPLVINISVDFVD